jgi:uncharacterized protein with PIN domain
MASSTAPRFVCDAMLGGLARWLRAAGYDASWQNEIDDHALIRLAQAEGRTLLSCDSEIFLFRVFGDNRVPALSVRRRPVAVRAGARPFGYPLRVWEGSSPNSRR